MFDSLIQDKGVGPDEENCETMKTRVFKAPDNRKYRDVWKLLKCFVNKLKNAEITIMIDDIDYNQVFQV